MSSPLISCYLFASHVTKDLYDIQSHLRSYYSSGPAEVYFDGKATGIKDLTLVFDSGSSYTYFNSQAYNAILALVKTEKRNCFLMQYIFVKL